MSNNPLIAAPVAEPTPVGDILPTPTPDQERAADQLFARPEEHNAALDLIGMVAATHLLHDLAVEAFQRNEEEENDPEQTKASAVPEEPKE